MFTKALIALSVIAIPQCASAASIGGNAALSLAALVAQSSPTVSATNKWRLRQYLNNHHAGPGAPATITISADRVHCRISDVDLTNHSCDLTFGATNKALNGRVAHELYATIVENGVAPEGAAGSMNVLLNALTCTIKPHDLSSGSGADCIYTP
jgi:hypothetical protein